MKTLPRFAAQDLQFKVSRAPGPGGQNVNKVATAVQLRLDLAGTQALPARIKQRLRQLAGSRLTVDGTLLISAHAHRTQAANRREALARLAALIEQASVEPKARVATRPTAGARERRLDVKRRQQRVKRLRAAVGED